MRLCFTEDIMIDIQPPGTMEIKQKDSLLSYDHRKFHYVGMEQGSVNTEMNKHFI